jgi:hypothetical protein
MHLQLRLDNDIKAFTATFTDIYDEEVFVKAKLIFNEGGNSESYAVLNIGWPLRRLNAGTSVIGTSASGIKIAGALLSTTGWFATKIYVRYEFATDSSQCRAGGLVEKDTTGCE